MPPYYGRSSDETVTCHGGWDFEVSVTRRYNDSRLHSKVHHFSLKTLESVSLLDLRVLSKVTL